MGEYGELLVLSEIIELKKKNKIKYFNYKGGQSKYDIGIFLNDDSKVKLEIRTSPYKKEWFFSKAVMNWGWKLQSRNQVGDPKEPEYDWIILVKLDDEWKPKYYTLSKSEVLKIQKFKWSGYKTVARAIHLFENVEMLKKGKEEEKKKREKYPDIRIIPKESEDFTKNPKKYELNWRKIIEL